MAEGPVVHWWQTAASIASFGAAIIAFLKGLSASQQHAVPPNDDVQTRLARAEGRLAILEDMVLAQLQNSGHVRQDVPPTALPAPTDSR